MGMKAYRFVGLNRDVWLPDWIRVSIRLVDHPNVTPRVKVKPQVLTTWHDTGNDKTNAEAEYRWLADGRPGGEAGGYNFIFDDGQIIQTGWLDERTWAAGTPLGNDISWHAEQAWGGGVNFQRSLEVGAALHGGLCAAMGWAVEAHLVRHQYWYGKWCPGQILNKGLWSLVVRMTQDAANRALAAAKGQTPLVAGFAVGDRVRVTTPLNIRRAWTTAATYQGVPNVIKTLPAGTEATIIAGPNIADGYTWWDVRIANLGTGHIAQGDAGGDWIAKVAAAPQPAPVPTPGYLAPLHFAALDEVRRLGDAAMPAYVDVSFEGKTYRAIPVFDRVRTIEVQKRLRRPDGTETELVGDWIPKGTEFDHDFSLLRLDDAARYAPMGVTPWGTFFWLKNVRRVADVRGG